MSLMGIFLYFLAQKDSNTQKDKLNCTDRADFLKSIPHYEMENTKYIFKFMLVFHGCFQGVSGVIQECFNIVSRAIKMYLMGASRVF